MPKQPHNSQLEAFQRARQCFKGDGWIMEHIIFKALFLEFSLFSLIFPVSFKALLSYLSCLEALALLNGLLIVLFSL